MYALLPSGCASLGPRAEPLRVGITADYPPLVFRQGGQFVGAEVELARALGEELGRPIQFVNVRWRDQIPALLGGKTDIIMSAMSITEARRVRVAFSEPYLKNELRVIFRKRDEARFTTTEAFMASDMRVGVVAGTTADSFVQRHGPRLRRTALETRKDAAFFLLRSRRIDAYVDDTLALAWILAENEASIAYLREPLAEEYIAWAVRPSDQELLQSVNAVLATWEEDGTLDDVIYRWMPFLEQLK
ncbi:MAG TPA: ABC transporter substrate-binding protein [Kiritimatiellia bacterium]|nr:ABC transporter substrate-binding protein [Kiritimatiellia bacterium]